MIRRAGERDGDALAALGARSFGHVVDWRRWWERVFGQAQLYVAERGGAVVGAVVAAPGERAQLVFLAVDEAERRRGIGRALLGAITAQLRPRRLATEFVDYGFAPGVNAEWLPAQRLLEAEGFVRLPHRECTMVAPIAAYQISADATARQARLAAQGLAIRLYDRGDSLSPLLEELPGGMPPAITTLIQHHADSPPLYTAVSEGVVRGLVAFTRHPPRGAVGPVAVGETFRRRGLARVLLERALEDMSRSGVSEAELWGAADSYPATRLYQPVGFRPVSYWLQYEKTL
jgi:mycothiol synthase